MRSKGLRDLPIQKPRKPMRSKGLRDFLGKIHPKKVDQGKNNLAKNK